MVWGNEHNKFRESPENTMTALCNKDEQGQDNQENAGRRSFGDKVEMNGGH